MIIDNYNINIVKSNKDIKRMIKYFDIFLKIKNNKFVAIDFEFNRINDERKIALFQLNLESKNVKTIFIFYPPMLGKDDLEMLKKLLFNENIIIHGGESLDIPYLFSEIFKNKNEIIKFCKNLVDTKFQCEFYNYKNNFIEYKCKIYLLLKQMNVINEDKYNELIINEEKMGPIYDILIDINNLDKRLIKYSVYDVLYLPRLISKFINLDHYNLIKETTNSIIILKYFGLIDENMELLNKLNNFYIIKDNKLLLFNKIVNECSEKLKHQDTNFKYLNNINYYKKFFNLVIKLSVYIYITNNIEYYIKKDTKGNNKLNNFEFYFKSIKDFKTCYTYLINLNSKIIKEILL